MKREVRNVESGISFRRSTVREANHLRCARCGKTERFIEVVFGEAHIVNGQRDHIALLEGVVDRYLCLKCSATVESEPYSRSHQGRDGNPA